MTCWTTSTRSKHLWIKLFALKILVRNEDVVMALLESLPTLYKHLIISIEAMPMKKPTRKFVMAHLMYELLKMNENESQSKDATLVLC